MEYNTFSQLTQHQHNSQSLNTTSTGPTSVNRTKTSQKIEITSNERLPPLKPFLPIMPTTSANTTTNNTTSTTTINNYNTITTNPLLMQKSSHNMNHIHDNKMNQKVFEKDQTKSHPHHQQHHLNNINNNHDNSHNKKSLLNSETKTLLTVQQQKQKMHQQNAAFGHHQGISMPPSPSSTSSPLPLPFTKQSNKSINNSNSQSTATSSSSSTSFAEFSHNANHVEPKEAPYGHKVASPTHDNVNSFPNTFDSATMATNQRLTTVVTPKNNSKNLETECFQNPNTFQHNTKDSTDNVLKTSLTETKASSSSSSAPTTTTTSISSNLAPQSSAPSSVSMASTTTVTSGHHLMDGTESYNKLSTDTLPSYLQYGNHQKATQQQQQQQQQFAQQQQSAKLRLYMPQYGMPQAHPHAHYYGSAMPQGPGGPPVVKNIPNYSPYYESMYDCGNGLPGAVDYVSAAAASVPVTHQASVPSTAPTPLPPALPTSSASSAVAAAAAAAYADYPAYTHHAPYHTNFPANNYGCSPLTTAVRGSPYMHWSPLVTSASLVDHHAAPNSMFTSATYANDAAAAAAVTQTSQWNQL